MQKVALRTTIWFILAVSFVHAQSDDPCCPLPCEITPAANPSIQGGANLFIFGDLLYWKAAEKGLPLGIVNENTPLPFANLNRASVKNLQGQWDFGMRVGAGYILPRDGWDLDATWLRFHPSPDRKTLHTSGTTLIFPTLAPSSDPLANLNMCTDASGRWKLVLDQLDVEMGRAFFVSPWLKLRPSTGIRADWITQKVAVNYQNFFGSNEVAIRYKDQWWGVGIEGGLDTQWCLGKGWSIFADGTIAILYGNHSLHFKDQDTPAISNVSNGATSTPDGVFADIEDSDNSLAHPILDLQLGLQWNWMSKNNRIRLGFHAGWENHIYFSQNQFPNFSDDFNFGKFFSNQGDLTLQGWAFGARLDF